jgi:CheY-like chemotaxis protein
MERIMAKKNVIIIDDDPDVIEATRVVLEQAGFGVQSALSGREGLELIRKGGIDCVLLDVMMTRDTEGFHVAQDLKDDPATGRIPIVMMTSVSKRTGFEFSPETDQDFLPVDAFLEKPVDPKKLVSTILGVLKG